MASLLDNFTPKPTPPKPAPAPLQTVPISPAINPNMFADLRNLKLAEIHTKSDAIVIGNDHYIRVHADFLIWQAQRINRAFIKLEEMSIPTTEIMSGLSKAIEFYHQCLDASGIQPTATTTDWKLPKPIDDMPDLAWSRAAFSCNGDGGNTNKTEASSALSAKSKPATKTVKAKQHRNGNSGMLFDS